MPGELVRLPPKNYSFSSSTICSAHFRALAYRKYFTGIFHFLAASMIL